MKQYTWIVICLVGIAGQAATEETKNQSHIIHFPPNASLGRLMIRDQGSQQYEDWKEHGPARGEVIVPDGKELRLTIKAETFRNLPELSSLEPNDIQELHVLSGDLADSDLKHIEGLKGLCELRLIGDNRNSCPFNGDGLRYLKGMESLRNLTLHNTSVRDASFIHLKDHKCLEEIHLVGNRNFNGEGIKYLKNVRSLRILWIFQTPIEDSGLEHIKGMTSLEVLTLPDTKVTDYGLAHLEGLTGLKYLTVPNTITDEGLAKLKILNSLETLRITSNAITDEGLIHLKELKSLKSLDIRSNTLTGEGLKYLRDLPCLSELELWLDQMNDSTMSHLKGLPVTALYLMSNDGISDEGLRHIADLTSMKDLYLDNTKITDSGLTHLSRLKSLESLDLTGTKITSEGLAHLQDLSELRFLMMFRTDIGDSGLAHLQNLKSLERLRLGETFVSDKGLKYLKGLNSLRDLDLMHTYVSGEGLTHIKELKSLRSLYLLGIDIGEEGAKHLKEMTWLHRLNIDAWAISAEEISSLKAALPDCRLIVEQDQENRRRPKFDAKSAPSLIGKPLPDFENIRIDFNPDQAKGRMLLVCFWDMNQRPSRNCIAQLAKKAEQLKDKGLVVTTVQASKIDQKKLDNWVSKYNVPFPVGIIEGDEKKIRFNWGVKSLPWLILTDKQRIVTAEGFGLDELDEKIKEAQNAMR